MSMRKTLLTLLDSRVEPMGNPSPPIVGAH